MTATLRRFEAEGQLKEDTDHVKYIMQYGFGEIQKAFEGIYSNFDAPILGSFFRLLILPWARINSFGSMPNDKLSTSVAQSMRNQALLVTDY